MVQRKAPNKLGSLGEPKKSHVLSEKRLSSHHQHDTRNKAGGDLKKIMKKSRSIKASKLESLTASPFGSRKIQLNNPRLKPPAMKTSNGSPNYMKPTSSSDARKERLQVTIHSPDANDKSKIPRNSNKSNYSKPPSPPPVNTGIRPAKTLARKSSLRPKRPSMKKSPGMVLYPKKNVNRATCSSTLKDSKFPKVLDLNPGGAESEGTSIMKVCPYTYCSLNGHMHKSLPPLKHFLSARRRLLKTQKSMKLKGLSSFRKRSLRKGRGADRINISSSPSELKITPLIEDNANDFFVEIYAKPKEPIREVLLFCDERRIQEDFSKEIAEILNNLSPMEDDWDWETSELEAEEGDVRIRSNQMPEIYSEISFGGGLDQDGESVEEMDAIMSILDSAECNQQAEAKEEISSCFLSEDYEEWGFECCMVNDLENRNGGLTESGESISTTKTTGMDSEEEGGEFPDKKTENPENLCDGFSLTLGPLTRNENKDDGFLMEPADTSITSEEGKVAEKCDAAASEGGALEGNFNDETCNMPHNLINNELTDVLEQQESPEENCLGDGLLMSNKNIYDSEECSIQDSEIFQCQPLHAQNIDVIPILGCDSSEQEDFRSADGSRDKSNLNTDIKEERNGNEMQYFDNLQGVSETDQDNMETDHVQSELEIKEHRLLDATEDSSVPPEISDRFIFEYQSDESNLRGTEEQEERQQEENCIHNVLQIKDAVRFDVDENSLEAGSENPETGSSNQSFPEASSKQKDRYRYSPIRRRTSKDLEAMKQFNPRAPWFLPIEPDPEAEKVDLRHQMMDERKNAESWMIDNALQQLVTRLAPARKRKVALLVEAFETVMPLPMCESPLQSPTSAFAIQACS